MSTSDLAFRAVVLALSALAHVLLYGALGLAPAWQPPPRTGLLVSDLVIIEPPTPAVSTPQPVTPPRPYTRPRPPKPLVETARPESPAKPPESTPKLAESPVTVQPSIEQKVPELPVPVRPPLAAAPASSAPGATASAVIEAVEAAPAPVPSGGAARATTPSGTTAASSGSAAAVAALPPASAPAPSGPLTRTAIPRGGYQVTPPYPPSARRLGIEGTTLLRVFVDANGRVSDIVVKKSAGHPDLDRAATDAVRRWQFDPARRGSDAVAMWVELPVEFHLR